MPGQIKYYKHLGKLDDEDPNSEDIHAFISSATEVGHKTAWTTMKNRAQIRKEIIIAKKDGKEIDRHSFNESADPLIELEEAKQANFSDDHLDKLRAEYGKLKTIDPSSDNYKKLIKFLDSLPQEHLAQLKNAKIPFLGRLAANRLKEDVEELDEAQKQQTSSHPYGLKHKEFGGRESRLRTVETWHKTSEARAKFADKLENKDGFYGIDGYSDPKGVKEETELDEMTSWVGKVMKDGDVHHVWQKSEGGYDYEIQNRKTGKKTYHKGSLDQLERKGYSWINEESELDEPGSVTAIRKNGKYEIIHGHYRNISEEVLNEKSVYQVKHDGVPADHSDKELVRLFSGKKDSINHTTYYPDSAKKAADMLKQKGFLNVRTFKDGKMLNEETELDENILATISKRKTAMLQKAKTSAAKVAIYGAKDHVELDAVKKRHSIEEEVELDEGKMSEIHMDLQDHLDKHIATFKKMGGAEALMGHAANAAKRLAKDHGIEHVHAKKFASDYIDSALKEEVEGQDEAVNQLDEVSGKLLGSYIQKARAENAAKLKHGTELDADPKVKAANDKISEYYKTRQFTKSGKHVLANKIDVLRQQVQKRKEKLDPDFPKSVIPKRHEGIRKALDKLRSGKMTESIEQLDEGVEVDHRSFEASHGKKARGWGRWLMCKHDRLDFDKHKEGVDYFEHTGNMRTAAKKAAKALKVKRIYVQP